MPPAMLRPRRLWQLHTSMVAVCHLTATSDSAEYLDTMRAQPSTCSHTKYDMYVELVYSIWKVPWLVTPPSDLDRSENEVAT